MSVNLHTLNSYRSFLRVHKTLPSSPYKSKIKYNVKQAFAIRRNLTNEKEIQESIRECDQFALTLPKLDGLLFNVQERAVVK